MKAIMISIRPQYVAKILNGEKTIEIRKMFPSDYVGWVYIYCTKGSKPLVKCSDGEWYVKDKDFKYDTTFSYSAGFNGKVVARFWCDKVEEIETDYAPRDTFFKECCLTPTELFDYIGHSKWYAIHITKLEIFDKPKEISEFRKDCWKDKWNKQFPSENIARVEKDIYLDEHKLTRAPQSWCYIEV